MAREILAGQGGLGGSPAKDFSPPQFFPGENERTKRTRERRGKKATKRGRGESEGRGGESLSDSPPLPSGGKGKADLTGRRRNAETPKATTGRGNGGRAPVNTGSLRGLGNIRWGRANSTNPPNTERPLKSQVFSLPLFFSFFFLN